MPSRRLAIRALNEARRTDPLAYLSLRHTVNSTVGLKDEWAREVAPQIVMGRGDSTFVESKQFKELNDSGSPEFRDVRYCGGPHQLAEAALIEACSIAGGSFLPSESVYSYRYANRYSSDGIYFPYFELFSKRQDDIGSRCRQFSRHCVVYLDIKSFYPSIKVKRTRSAWKRACRDSNLDDYWAGLGNYLIDLQFTQGDGLLVGPQFSHLLANLYLRNFDAEMESEFPKRYFRYVDDFAFIVKYKEIDSLISFVKERLKPLGLRLNDSKTHWMGARKWEKNAPFQSPDYADENVGDQDWMHFIDHLKRFLLVNPGRGSEVRTAFSDNNMRVPVPRYEAAVKEGVYQVGLQRRRKRAKFDGTTANISIDGIVKRGLILRSRYLEELNALWPEFQESSGLLRKWKRSRVRYLIGRSLLLATEAQLHSLHETVSLEPELAEYGAMLETVVTGEADQLLRFGWKPCLALAPALAATGREIRAKRERWSQEALEGLIALKLGGCKIHADISANAKNNNRYKVGMAEHSPSAWTTEKSPFYRELMSLSGGSSFEGFVEMLQTPIDPDEDWTVFSEELLGLNPT